MNIDHILRGLSRFEVGDQLDRNLLDAAAEFLRDQAARVAELEAQLEEWKHRAARVALKANHTLAMDALAKMAGEGGS